MVPEKKINLFNKGKRIIQASIGNIEPEKVVDVPEEEAKKLLRLYPTEILEVAGGQSGQDADDQKKAQDVSDSKDDSLKKDEVKSDGNDEEEKSSEGDEEGIEEVITEEDIEKMSKPELISFIKESGLDIQFPPNIKVANLRKKVIDVLKEDSEEIED